MVLTRPTSCVDRLFFTGNWYIWGINFSVAFISRFVLSHSMSRTVRRIFRHGKFNNSIRTRGRWTYVARIGTAVSSLKRMLFFYNWTSLPYIEMFTTFHNSIPLLSYSTLSRAYIIWKKRNSEMGKISKILLKSLALASVGAQTFGVTSCDDPNAAVSIWFYYQAFHVSIAYYLMSFTVCAIASIFF